MICCFISISSSMSLDRFLFPCVGEEEDGVGCGNCDDLQIDSQFHRFRRPVLELSDSNDCSQ